MTTWNFAWDSARALDATLSTIVLLLIVPAAYAAPGLLFLRGRFPRWVTVHMVLLGLTGLGAAAAVDLAGSAPFIGPLGWTVTVVAGLANLVLVVSRWRDHRAVIFEAHRRMWAITER